MLRLVSVGLDGVRGMKKGGGEVSDCLKVRFGWFFGRIRS